MTRALAAATFAEVTRPCASLLLAAITIVGLAATPTAASPPYVTGSYAVPAARERLTADRRSPVSHDNEVMALAAQQRRLFAATDQWQYPGPDAHGQVLVKDSARSPWRVFERT